MNQSSILFLLMDTLKMDDNILMYSRIAYSWLKKDRKKRRLVVVCSMSSRYKAKLEKDMMLNLEQFNVYSWKEEGIWMLFRMTNSSPMSRLHWIMIYRLIRLVKTWSALNSTLRVRLQDGCFFLRPKL